MGHDSIYDKDSHGLTARFWGIGSFILNKYVDDVVDETKLREDDFYKPFFAKYFENVDKIPNCGDVKFGGKEWFERLPKNFMLGMRKGFNDHISSVWRSPMIMPYMIAAPPEFAHHFILYLEHVVSGKPRGSYNFPNENIRVSYFNEEVNVRDLLKWLTDEFEDKDFVTVFEDQMIQPHWDLLLKMAKGGVNVYNKDTWSSDGEYDELLDMFHRRIAPQSTQGQKIENHIQMISRTAKNNKGEARRTWLAWIRSFINCQFNPHAVRLKKSDNRG